MAASDFPWDDINLALAHTEKFATDIVAPHLVDSTEDAGFRHPPDDAPETAKLAAVCLRLIKRLDEARRHGDADAAAEYAFFAGMLAGEVWLIADKGKTIADAFAALSSRGRPDSLTDEQKADIVDQFNNLKNGNATNNAAAEKLGKLFSVSTTTILRVVGLRQ